MSVVENCQSVFDAFGGDPRVVSSVSNESIRKTQEIITNRGKAAEKYRSERLDNPLYDPRVEAAQKVYGDATSGRA